MWFQMEPCVRNVTVRRNAVSTETETTLLPIQEVFQILLEGFIVTSVFPQPCLPHALAGVLWRAKVREG